MEYFASLASNNFEFYAINERTIILSFARFKLILGGLQIDNMLPLSLMPVLLAPEQMGDVHHPVFKMTITMHNEDTDGIKVFPYVYLRVCFI